MMTLRPISPTLDRMFSLDRELDRVFGNALTNGGSRVWHPATDVIEQANGYLVSLELPGVQPDAVEVVFEQNTLTVRGTKAPTVQPTEDAELRIYTAERVSGAFERSFRLPEHVDGNAIQATFQNGVLSISIPKKPASQPRKIAINSTEPKIAG
ncbi:MAG: Hsp20/alpha crystallin family protein [Gemmatimonas sp.]|nr:Hsp20/alpha crystallin family protein [Gemmatimonadaceae bacterium]